MLDFYMVMIYSKYPDTDYSVGTGYFYKHSSLSCSNSIGDKDEIRYSNSFVRIPAKYGERT